MGSTTAAKPHGESGHPWSIPLLAWMCAEDPSCCMRRVVEPVYHRENTVVRSRSCCPRLCSMWRLDIFWKAAFKSKATRTRDWSASAKYWMDLIILLAPSWHPTPCWSGPAAAMTDGFLAAMIALSASLRRKDIMRSGLCPPVVYRVARPDWRVSIGEQRPRGWQWRCVQ